MVKLQPYGSYLLGTAGKTSDIDCILLLPDYVTVDGFMEILECNLDSCVDVVNPKYIKGKFKIITLEYKGVEFDL